MLEEALMQTLAADRTVSRVDRRTYLRLSARQPHRRRGVPACIPLGEPLHRLGKPGEHGIDQALRERRLADVPVDEQSAAQLGDLGVQQHLWRLRSDSHRLAKGLDDLVGKQLTEIKSTGEDDRREHRLTPTPPQIVQHFKSGIG
jgi:hypothetical protein